MFISTARFAVTGSRLARRLLRARRGAMRATLVACVLVCAGAALAPSALALSTPNVTLTNDLAGQQSQYTVEFTPTNAIEPGTTITLAGPAGTVFPSSEYNYTIYTLVGGYPYSGYSILNPVQLSNNGAEVTLTANSGTLISGGQDMEVVVAGVTNPSTTGSDTLSVSTAGDPSPSQSNPYQIAGDPATSLMFLTGSATSAHVGQAFSGPLEVEATDQSGNPVAGVSVTFTAPSSGSMGNLPTGTFPFGSSTDTVMTGSDGIASSDQFTADFWAGSYDVRASANGLSLVSLAVSNLPGPPSSTLDQGGDAQSAQVGTAYALPLTVQVTDDHGNPVPDTTVTFTAPSSGPSGTFANGSTTDTETTNSQGYATSTVFTADSTAGSFDVTASDSGPQSVLFGLTNNLAGPSQVAAVAGGEQSSQVKQSFASALSVKVTDSYGNAIQDAEVTFSAPSSGASAIFSGGSTIDTMTTNAEGIASAPAPTANGIAGGYEVTATVSGAAPAAFSLTNLPGPAHSMSLVAGDGQSARIGAPFPKQFMVEVADQYGNPISGAQVTFTAPSTGASGTFPSGSADDTETTGSNGIATSAVLTADTTAGTYLVRANAGGLTPVVFTLTNQAPATTTTSSNPLVSNRFTVSGIHIHPSGAVNFKLDAPGPGMVDAVLTGLATGRSHKHPARLKLTLGRVHLHIGHNGTVEIEIRPTAQTQKLARDRSYPLVITLSVTFTPTGGAARERTFSELPVGR